MVSEQDFPERKETLSSAFIRGFLAYEPPDNFNKDMLDRIYRGIRKRYSDIQLFCTTHLSRGDCFFGRDYDINNYPIDYYPSLVLVFRGSSLEPVSGPAYEKWSFLGELQATERLRPTRYGLVVKAPSTHFKVVKETDIYEGDLFFWEFFRGDEMEGSGESFPEEFLDFTQRIAELPYTKRLEIRRGIYLYLDILTQNIPFPDRKKVLGDIGKALRGSGFKLKVDSESFAIGNSGNSLVYLPGLKTL